MRFDKIFHGKQLFQWYHICPSKLKWKRKILILWGGIKYWDNYYCWKWA